MGCINSKSIVGGKQHAALMKYDHDLDPKIGSTVLPIDDFRSVISQKECYVEAHTTANPIGDLYIPKEAYTSKAICTEESIVVCYTTEGPLQDRDLQTVVCIPNSDKRRSSKRWSKNLSAMINDLNSRTNMEVNDENDSNKLCETKDIRAAAPVDTVFSPF